jgi:hypothetical protein
MDWFIHRQMLPPGNDDAFARRANSSAFDIGTLKNGNQMAPWLTGPKRS